MQVTCEIKGNELISHSDWNTHRFQIVEKVPAVYRVWNIGTNLGTNEYIPFCMMTNVCDPECFDVRTDNLLAVKLPQNEVLSLRYAAMRGIENLRDAERALRFSPKARRIVAEQVVDIFRRITEGVTENA